MGIAALLFYTLRNKTHIAASTTYGLIVELMGTLFTYLRQKLLSGNQMKPEVSELQAAPKTVPGLTLYYSPFCGYCLRVFSALQMMRLEIATRNVMSDREAATELRREGGSGMVPCLRIEEGSTIRWMYESADIIDYLRQYEAIT